MAIKFQNYIQIAGVIDQTEAQLLINCGITCLGFPLRLPVHKAIVQSLLSSNFAVIPQFLVKGRFFNQIQVDV